MTTEVRTSKYHYRDWWPIIRPIDLVPLVGIVTNHERIRRARGITVAEAYLPWRDPMLLGKSRTEIATEILSLGTAGWPETTNLAARLRSHAMAARNGLFLGYQAIQIPYLALELLHRLGA